MLDFFFFFKWAFAHFLRRTTNLSWAKSSYQNLVPVSNETSHLTVTYTSFPWFPPPLSRLFLCLYFIMLKISWYVQIPMGFCSIKEAFHFLNSKKPSNNLQCTRIWKTEIPIKPNIFLWNVLMRDFPQERKFLDTPTRLCNCPKCGLLESTSPMFFETATRPNKYWESILSQIYRFCIESISGIDSK